MNKKTYFCFALFAMLFGLFIPTHAQPDDVLIDHCVTKAGDDATYLKDFVVKLEAAGPGEKAPVAKYSMILKQNTVYRFTICDAENSGGKCILQLYDTKRMIASNLLESSGQIFQSFDFKCQKTGVYHLFFSFKEGQAGRAIGILSFVEKL